MCILSQLFFIYEIPIFASDVEYESYINHNLSANEHPSNTAEMLSNPTDIELPEITYTITNPINSNFASIRIAFDQIEGATYSYNAEGLTVIEQPNAPIYDLVASNTSFGTFMLEAELDDGNICSKTIYTYNNGTFMFASEASRDLAFHKCKQFELENELITLDDWKTEYSALSLDFSVPILDASYSDNPLISTALNSGKLVVRGKMQWQTESGNYLPLRDAKIELRKQNVIGSIIIGTTYTDKDGEYYFILDRDTLNISPILGISLFIRTYTESTTFNVMHPFFDLFNYFDSNIVNVSSSATEPIYISRQLKEDNVLYKLAYIQQAMVVGQKFATSMGMEADKILSVYYLVDLDTGISIDGDIGNLINSVKEFNDSALCYDNFSLVGYNTYNDITTIIHEYGHYVENRIGTYGSAIKGQINERMPDEINIEEIFQTNWAQVAIDTVNDYIHDYRMNNFDRTTTTKQFQMELTWSEAWATIFARIALEYCNYSFTDISLTDTNIYEFPTEDIYDGEASEYAVLSFLWDLYDGTSHSDNIKGDTLKLEAENWWNITTAEGTYTIQDLIENILNNYPELIDGVGGLLTNHNIAPNLSDTIISPCNNGELVLQWAPNGGNDYPNDKFKVVFYDENNNVIEESDEVIIADGTDAESGEKDISIVISNATTSEGICVCTVSKNLWLSVLSKSNGSPIYAAIYGYRSGDFYSGPYVSNFVSVWDDESNHTGEVINAFDNETHWIVCECGATFTEKIPHEEIYSYYNSTLHQKNCQACEFIVLEEHTFNILHSVNEANHIYECACGALSTSIHSYDIPKSAGMTSYHNLTCKCGAIGGEEPHSVSRHAMIDGFYHNNYCECGHLIGQERHEWKSSGLFYICKHCGYKKSNLDGPILLKVEEDEEDF